MLVAQHGGSSDGTFVSRCQSGTVLLLDLESVNNNFAICGDYLYIACTFHRL